jgi:hypothetical protein
MRYITTNTQAGNNSFNSAARGGDEVPSGTFH